MGFQRDLLTAAAYGVDEFLFVYGDRPESGTRSDDLTVRSMITEARRFVERSDSIERPWRIEVSSGLRALPAWKQEADFVFAQVAFSLEALLQWRATVEFEGPVYAAVMVIASAPMARKLSQDIPQLAVPAEIIAQLERDRDAGVKIAYELISEIRDSNAFDGVHLIPVSRYRDMASLLEANQ